MHTIWHKELLIAIDDELTNKARIEGIPTIS